MTQEPGARYNACSIAISVPRNMNRKSCQAAAYSFFRVNDMPTAFGPELDATAAPIW